VGARPKFAYLRSEVYRRFVSAQPCFACGREGNSNACHPNSSRYGKGRSIKAGDQYVFPLCIMHHAMHDTCFEMSKAERDALEESYVERMQKIAADDGWNDGVKRKKEKE
jgi:hypothetical protein